MAITSGKKPRIIRLGGAGQFPAKRGDAPYAASIAAMAALILAIDLR